MNAPLPAAVHFDVQSLAHAVSQCQAADALRCNFSLPHWNILGAYLQPFPLGSGQVLIEQGAHDSSLYFVESGTLSAHYEDEEERNQMTLVDAGAVVGEGSFFSKQPRRATVYASSPCKLWCLTAIRFKALASQHGPIALELTLAMASVMANRLRIRSKQAAVT